MFYSTHVRANVHSLEGKDTAMTFALMLVLVLLLSSAYLFHQWYTNDLDIPDPGP